MVMKSIKKYILIVATILFFILSLAILKNSNKFIKAINDPGYAFQALSGKVQYWISTNRLHNQYSKEEKYIYMRDSVMLFTSIYTPIDKTERYPILIWRTPYNIETSEDKYSYLLRRMQHLLDEKYIFVFQDVRGRYMSEGDFIDIRPFIPNKKGNETDENSDAYDTIEWLLKNVANNNGKVGILGISYPGFYAALALPNAHPALKAVSPQAPITNWFLGDDWHHNGAFFLLDAFSFYSNFGQPRSKLTRKNPIPFELQIDDTYNFFKEIGPIKNIERDFFGDSIQFWKELMTHPNYDIFWKRRNYLPHLTSIKPAVLVVGGWFDSENLFGSLKLYESIEKLNKDNNQNRIILGPWYHTQWAWDKGESFGDINFGSNTSAYFKEAELQFFNYYLKDKGELKLPEASIFITGANEWREFENWPPGNLDQMDLYLECNEHLSLLESTDKECFNEYIVDPNNPVPYSNGVSSVREKEYMIEDQRFANERSDVMVYQTKVLNNDIIALGPIKVHIYVSTSGTDADYIVKIIDVFPEQLNDYPKNEKNIPMGGYQMLVRGDVLRGKFRNSLEEPQPIVPNEIVEISFELPDIAHQFKKGHRIMIQVQNSWFPLVDINPQKFLNIYEAEEKDFIEATHRIYHDAQYPSKISFDVWGN